MLGFYKNPPLPKGKYKLNPFPFIQRIKTSIQSQRSKHCPRIKMHRLWVLLVSLVLTLLVLLPLIILQNVEGISKDLSAQSGLQIPTHLSKDSHCPRDSHVFPHTLATVILECHCARQAGDALASSTSLFCFSYRPWAKPSLLEWHLYYLHNQAISVNNVINKSY